MSYYQDILFKIFENKKGISIVQGSEYSQEVYNNFIFDGNVINWNKHKKGRVNITLEFNNEKRIEKIINESIRLILENSVFLNKKIIYFSDDCFDEEVIFDNFYILDNYIKNLTENFPQRGYYTDENANWCLCLREHSMIDFAFSV